MVARTIRSSALTPNYVAVISTDQRPLSHTHTARCVRHVYSKTPFNLTLSGITNDDVDLSVDALKAVTLPLLKKFGVAEEGGLELKVCVALLATRELWF